MSFRPINSAKDAPSLPAKPVTTAGAVPGPVAATTNGSAQTGSGTPTSASASAPSVAVAGPAYPYSAYTAPQGQAYDQSQGLDYSAYYAAYGGQAGPSTAAYAAAGPSSYGNYSYGFDGASYGAVNFGTTDEELIAQQSIYTPDNAAKKDFTKKAQKGQARTTVLRKGGGEVWEDQTLMEWDPSHFRLFIGDLGNDVNEDDLVKAFGPEKGWTSFVKAKVIRDKVTNKTRGYGFVAYSDPEDFMKAWKGMDGKYVGSRPVKISKASTQVRQVDIGQKKAKELDTKKKTNYIGNKVRGAVNPNGTWKPYIRR